MAKEEKKTIELELHHITEDGKGVGFSKTGKLIIVEGVDEDDEVVNIQIVKELEESILAKKIASLRANTQIKSKAIEEPGVNPKGTPYELDNEDDFTDEEYLDEDDE